MRYREFNIKCAFVQDGIRRLDLRKVTATSEEEAKERVLSSTLKRVGVESARIVSVTISGWAKNC